MATIIRKIKKLLVIVGSAKSGTTALAHHLSTHPEMVLGRVKEPRFFTDFAERTWIGPASKGFRSTLITEHGSYIENFQGLEDEKWAVDASTDYIWCDKTPELLRHYSEDCDLRVIAIVRDPVDRAVSEYNHTLRHGWETLSFDASIEAEPDRYEQGWHPLFYHMRRSRIRDDIHRFHEAFGHRFLVIDYESLADIDALMRRLCAFLDISEFHPATFEKKNVSYLPRNRMAARMLDSQRLRSVSRLIVPASMRTSIRKMLHTDAKNVATVRSYERSQFVERLADEIECCIGDPLIPTDNWFTSTQN